MTGLLVCLCTTCMPGTHRSQKMVLDSLKCSYKELRAALWVLENWTWDLWKSILSKCSLPLSHLSKPRLPFLVDYYRNWLCYACAVTVQCFKIGEAIEKWGLLCYQWDHRFLWFLQLSYVFFMHLCSDITVQSDINKQMNTMNWHLTRGQ